MKLQHSQAKMVVVDLTDKIFIRTPIPSQNHAALRAGFGGYPVNPRWNAVKFHAWQTGRKLRDALSNGKMIVRSEDSMLVESTDVEEPVPGRSIPWQQLKFIVLVKQLRTFYTSGKLEAT